jgi:hypothetical protein
MIKKMPARRGELRDGPKGKIGSDADYNRLILSVSVIRGFFAPAGNGIQISKFTSRVASPATLLGTTASASCPLGPSLLRAIIPIRVFSGVSGMISVIPV